MLSEFKQSINFYSSLNQKKTFGFLLISGGGGQKLMKFALIHLILVAKYGDDLLVVNVGFCSPCASR